MTGEKFPKAICPTCGEIAGGPLSLIDKPDKEGQKHIIKTIALCKIHGTFDVPMTIEELLDIRAK